MNNLQSRAQLRSVVGLKRLQRQVSFPLFRYSNFFRKLDEEDFLLIYKTYIKVIRPHLEYCEQGVWSTYLAVDIQ